MTLIVAHQGGWDELIWFLIPILIVAGWISWAERRRRLRQPSGHETTTSALAGNVGDVQREAEAPLARTQDVGALGCAARTRTPRSVSLDVLNAANVGGRGTSMPHEPDA